MGLRENPLRTSGWYDGYIEAVYEENGYSHKLADAAAKADIKKSLSEFVHDPVHAVGFFERKIVSQWNEPTFESLFIQMNRDSRVEAPGIVSVILDGEKGNTRVIEFFNLMQLLILFGLMLYLVFDKSESTVYTLLFGICFLGGFFFHIMWEASSQYSVIYFLLIIPYSVIGYADYAGKLEHAVIECRDDAAKDNRAKCFVPKILKNTCVIYPVIFVFVCIVLFLLPDGNFARIFKPAWNTEQYIEFRGDKSEKPALREGRYYISPYNDLDRVVSVSGNSLESGTLLTLDDIDAGIEQRIIVFEDSGFFCFRLQNSQKVFDIADGDIEKGNYLQQWDYNGDKGQHFTIKKGEKDNSFMIFTDDGTLMITRSEDEKLILSDVFEDENGLWMFVSK